MRSWRFLQPTALLSGLLRVRALGDLLLNALLDLLQDVTTARAEERERTNTASF